ncbi:zinc ribbon domain-containing protein [Micromonospora sp. NPDC049460]|uniref:zinc ribbon domain-containing protein n=1 Tax=unclassified Micromonospora TaxID=2617518 RepID=UPI00371CD135
MPEPADGADRADDPDEEPVPAPRPRRALAAPHTSPLVATEEDPASQAGRTTTGRTSGRPRAGGLVGSEPEEVTPQPVRPRTATTGRRASTRRLEPGDLICGECGEGNPPTRRFCSRCGDSLRTAEVVRRRWWQRLLPRRGPKVAAAGTRPGAPGGGSGGGSGGGVVGVLHRVYQRANAVAAVLLFALGVAYLIYPPLRERVNAVVVPPVRDARAWVDRKLNPRFVAARPVEVTGSASVAEHGPDLTVDQYRNTHWQVRWDAEQPPTVTLRFGAEVDLERLIVTAGTAEDYTASHRPAKLHLVWSTNRSDTLTVQDTGEPQTLTLTAAKGVTSVQIQVTDVYRAEKGTDVAVSELEFFARE